MIEEKYPGERSATEADRHQQSHRGSSMTPERWERVKELFEAALEREPATRRSFLHAVCQGDEALFAEVESLLSGDRRAGDFLEKPALVDAGTAGVPPALAASTESVGVRIGTLSLGDVLSGRFRVIRFLGRGGMGEVYEAKDLDLGDRVALKTIRPEIASQPRSLARFKQEIQLARRVTHPNVCRMFDLERHRPPPEANPSAGVVTFLTMELLEGETLATRLRRVGRMTTSEALPVVRQMAEALVAAHDVGVVHRDFKPGNVMLVPAKSGDRPERAVVTDFGLARALAAADHASGEGPPSSVTAGGHMIGTVAYMAPEQLQGREATPASDIYAFGLVMYEMVTGKRPFPDDALFGGAYQRIAQPPASPRVLVPDLDPQWESAIMRCLEADPASRFASVRDVIGTLRVPASALAPAQRGTGVVASGGAQERTGTDQPPRPQPQPPKGRKRLLVGSVSVVLVVALSAAILRVDDVKTKANGLLARWLHRQVAFAEHDWIAMADFNNQTGNKVFDHGVSDLLAQAMQQSRYVNVVPHAVLLDAARRASRSGVTVVDAVLGRTICLQEKYRALLTGQVVNSGGGYRIMVQVEEPQRQGAVIRDSEPFTSQGELYRAEDGLAKRLRASLGEPQAQIQNQSRPLVDVTTSSPEALHRYSRALDLFEEDDFSSALQLASAAVELDPDFTMAHLLLARIWDQLGNDRESDKHLEAARSRLDHVSEREKHLILAATLAGQNDEKAAEQYRLVLELYPDDIEALRGLADTAYWVGRPEEAIHAAGRALELSPNRATDYNRLVDLLNRTNRFDESLAVYAQAVSRKVESADSHFGAGIAYWGKDDLDSARKEFELLAAGGGTDKKNMSTLYLARLLIYQGRLREADEALRTGLLLDEQQGSDAWIPLHRYLLVRDRLLEGPASAATAEVQEFAASARRVPSPENLQRAGSAAVELGRLDMARALLSILDGDRQQQKGNFIQLHYYNLKGNIERAEGNFGQAIETQRRALVFLASFEPYLSLAAAYAAQHNWQAAIQAYEKYLAFRGEILRDDFAADWVVAHLQLGRVCASAGDSSGAARDYDEFLRLWAKADANIPLLSTAKDERRKLR
jgi:eukaryotic-like serine/threonine-protein kinase